MPADVEEYKVNHQLLKLVKWKPLNVITSRPHICLSVHLVNFLISKSILNKTVLYKVIAVHDDTIR